MLTTVLSVRRKCEHRAKDGSVSILVTVNISTYILVSTSNFDRPWRECNISALYSGSPRPEIDYPELTPFVDYPSLYTISKISLKQIIDNIVLKHPVAFI
jgi:hypothetical protein